MDTLTPAALWSQVDLETRLLAARAVYSSEWDDAASRAEANEAIASALDRAPGLR